MLNEYAAVIYVLAGLLLIFWLLRRYSLYRQHAMLRKNLADIGNGIEYLFYAFEQASKKVNLTETMGFYAGMYQNFYTDMFDSVSKRDLRLIYRRRMEDVVWIYEMIREMRTYAPDMIYKDVIAEDAVPPEQKKRRMTRLQYYMNITKGITEKIDKLLQEHRFRWWWPF